MPTIYATTRVSVTPTVTAATYAANKVVGGVMTFPDILSEAAYAGILESLTLKFKGSIQTVTFNVALFDAVPTGTFTNTSTAAIAAADTASLLGIYQLTTASSVLGTHTIYNLDAIARALQGQSTSLYAVVVPSATTAALGSTSDMTLTIGMLPG